MGKAKQIAADSIGSIFGKPQVRRLPAMEFEILCYSTPMRCALERRGEELVFRQYIPLPTEQQSAPKAKMNAPDSEINAGALKDVFLKIRTPQEALNFLGSCGRFRAPRHEEKDIESVLSWEEFLLWQEIVKTILVENHFHLGEFESPVAEMFIWGPSEDGWGGISRLLPDDMKRLALNAPKSTFDWLRGFPHEVMYQCEPKEDDPLGRPEMSAGVITDTALDAILASVFVETLNGIQYELCGFPDCSNVYEVRTNHKRDYCSQACAHKASLRRRRADAKAAREKSKKRKQRRTTRKAGG